MYIFNCQYFHDPSTSGFGYHFSESHALPLIQQYINLNISEASLIVTRMYLPVRVDLLALPNVFRVLNLLHI